MKYIPRRTKVKMEFAKGITIGDIIFVAIGVAVLLLLIFSQGIDTNMKIYLSVAWVAIIFSLFLPIADGKRLFTTLGILFKFLAYKKKYSKRPMRKHVDIKELIPYTNIANDMIDFKEYYAAVIEIRPIEFGLLNEEKQEGVIRTVADALRLVSPTQNVSIVKTSKPMVMDGYIYNEDRKYDAVLELANDGEMTKEEVDARSQIFEARMQHLRDLSNMERTYMDHFYIVIYDKDREGLTTTCEGMIKALSSGIVPLMSWRLKNNDLAVFLKSNYGEDFNESELGLYSMNQYADWTIPDEIVFKTNKTVIDGKNYSNFSIIDYPISVPNAWAWPFFHLGSTKVVVNLSPIQKDKAERTIDRSIVELDGRMRSTFKSSKQIDLQAQHDTLTDLLSDLKIGNEDLFDVHIHIMCAEAVKKEVRAILKQNGFKYSEMFGRQVEAFVGTNISKIDKDVESSRNIHTTSIAAMFPFISNTLQDSKGFYVGYNSYPVFIDFFVNMDKDNPLHDERVNANMIVIGKSGSGKSYATKTLLANLAADNTRIFILDPEKEYTDLTRNLGGKYIDVGSSVHGILNPFHIMTNLSDDDEILPELTGEETEEELAAYEKKKEALSKKSSDSYNMHLQFLEEYFRIIFEGMSGDAFEILNSLVVEIYRNKNIDNFTDLSTLKPEDYPIFDDLYNLINKKIESETDEYIRRNLQILQVYVQKFATGGRNSKLWNGPTSIETDENLVCFNFQSLLSNRNMSVASAQMLLVFKYLDNEILKNKDFNDKYKTNRKIIVTVDEAHLFINPKYPVALEFMAQMAKRIRKYNGMQIVITQNIKDFVGSKDIERQASAVINASQYSMIFSLSPNDITDLVNLYRNAGEINEDEQDTIVTAGRGQCFFIASPYSRTTFMIEANPAIKKIAKL